MRITLTDEQEQALEVVVRRFLSGERYTVVAGVSGSGKSSLVPFIIEALCGTGRVRRDDFIFTSFTGKAVQVLQKKGMSPVSTLHKLLYKHFPNGRGGFIRKLIPEIEPRVVIVDEVSMVSKTLIAQLFSHKHAYIICFGDDAQLAPIDKGEDNGLLSAPHARLTQVQRQALESGVLRLATDIRMGKSLRNMKEDDVMVISKADFDPGMLTWADQILCAKNETRMALNHSLRKMLGHDSQEPVDGDKIICLRNYWDFLSDNGEPLVNGAIGTLKNSMIYSTSFPLKVCKKSIKIIDGQFETDSDDLYRGVISDLKRFTKGEPSLDWKEESRFGKNGMIEMLPKAFDYGYAITGWKAQGSEWDKVLLFEENFPFDPLEKRRFLYTSITRAAQKIIVVRK